MNEGERTKLITVKTTREKRSYMPIIFRVSSVGLVCIFIISIASFLNHDDSQIIPETAAKPQKPSSNFDITNNSTSSLFKCDSISTSLYTNINTKFEPSDLSWNSISNNSFFVVSDNGLLYEIHIDGTVLYSWKIGKKLDLEAVLFIPSSPNTIYLGVEYPAQIIHYSLVTKSILFTFDIQQFVDSKPPSIVNEKNSGIESLIYLESSSSLSGGYFYAGRQFDARIFIFEILKSNTIVFKGSFQPPGPMNDLSAMTVYNQSIYFLYDKDQKLVSIPSAHPIFTPQIDNNSIQTLTVNSKDIGIFSSDIRGFEGITFGVVNNVEYLIIAVDPPKDKGKKDILRYLFNDFQRCFQQ